MGAPVRVLVVLDEGADRRRIEQHLPRESGIEIMEVVEGVTSGWGRREEDVAVDALVIAVNGPSEDALALVQSAVREEPERPVVLLSQVPAGDYVRRAFAAGADDIVVLHPADGQPVDPDDAVFALQKAVARRAVPADSAASGQGTLICVLGPKGGIGKTLTSCNLAMCLAERDASVVLVDLDLQFGDLGLSLGLPPDNTSYDLSVSGGSLDEEKVDAFLVTHSSGVKVLLAPRRPDQAGVVTVDFLQEVYRLLRRSYDYVIVDTPPGFSPEVIATIDASSYVCMIGMLDALSLKNTKLGLETLELMGYDAENIRLVLNRADSDVGITHNDVVSVLGRPPDVLVPSTRDITRSVNEGIPISVSAKRSEAAKAFRSLAEIYAASRTGARPARASSGLLGRRG